MYRPASGGTWVSAEIYEMLWTEFFRLASDESLGQPGNDGAPRDSAGLLGFGSVNWDRFRHPGGDGSAPEGTGGLDDE